MKIRSFLSVLLLLVSSLNASIDNPHAHSTKVPAAAILGAMSLGVKSLRCSDSGFTVQDKDGVQLVERGDTDDVLRRITPNTLQMFMQKGKIKISKASDGKYILRSQIDGLGGGFGGAWLGATIGKLVVSGLGHGTLLAVSFVAGPGQPAALIALEATFGVAIEAAANTAALTVGLAGAVATGPV